MRRIAVGAGYGFREHELGKIASNSSYVLKVFGVNEMFSKLENVINLACDEQDIGKFGSLTLRKENIEKVVINAF